MNDNDRDVVKYIKETDRFFEGMEDFDIYTSVKGTLYYSTVKLHVAKRNLSNAILEQFQGSIVEKIYKTLFKRGD